MGGGGIVLLPEVVTAVADEMLSGLGEVGRLEGGIPEWSMGVCSYT